ncbi:C40 family peptidase [bacterium]|nr:C40 family peptidase [bacterium]
MSWLIRKLPNPFSISDTNVVGISRIIPVVVATLLLLTGCAGVKPKPEYNRDRANPPVSSTETGRKSAPPAGRIDEPVYTNPGGPDNLDATIESWWGTPYRYGGSRKGSGVDCSAYVQQVYRTVYNLPLPRTSAQQFKQGWAVGRDELRRGDLVFFNTSGKGVSHVGIYLGAGMFTHASSSDGVTINRLSESYYTKRFMGARRVQ